MSPMVLGQALAQLLPHYDPNVLVDTSTADDAGVYKLTDDIALVQTVDFFTPIVDDPYMYGRISAANSLSSPPVASAPSRSTTAAATSSPSLACGTANVTTCSTAG